MTTPFSYTYSDKSSEILDRLEKAKSFAERAANDFIEILKNSFDTGGSIYGTWEPLKLRKGKPLVDSGSLKSSFVKTQIDPSTFTVHSDHKAAPIMEYGAIMKMTPEQRAKLFGYIIPKNMYSVEKLKGTGMIKIPERPFFRPGFDLVKERYIKFLKFK